MGNIRKSWRWWRRLQPVSRSVSDLYFLILQFSKNVQQYSRHNNDGPFRLDVACFNFILLFLLIWTFDWVIRIALQTYRTNNNNSKYSTMAFSLSKTWIPTPKTYGDEQRSGTRLLYVYCAVLWWWATVRTSTTTTWFLLFALKTECAYATIDPIQFNPLIMCVYSNRIRIEISRRKLSLSLVSFDCIYCFDFVWWLVVF